MTLKQIGLLTLGCFAIACAMPLLHAEQQHQFATKFWGDDAGTSTDKSGKNWSGTQTVPIAMYVDAAPSPWHSITMEERIATTLTRSSGVQIASVALESDPTDPHFSFAKQTDDILAHAEQLGARYAVIVTTRSPRIERKKTLHVPLVFHMYQASGIIDGELRIYDLSRKRQLTAEPFSVSKEGPRALQATMDDDINDPDLHITAPQKLQFFEELEIDAADYVAKRVRKVARGH